MTPRSSTPPSLLSPDLVSGSGGDRPSPWVTALSLCVLVGLLLTATLVGYAASAAGEGRRALAQVTRSTRSAMTLQFLSSDLSSNLNTVLSGAQRELTGTQSGGLGRLPGSVQRAPAAQLTTLRARFRTFGTNTPLSAQQRADLGLLQAALARIALLDSVVSTSSALSQGSGAGTTLPTLAQQATAALSRLSDSLSSQAQGFALAAEQATNRALRALWLSAALGLLMLALTTLLLLNVARARAAVIRQLRQLAHTDGLTGVYNRRAWDLTLEQAAARLAAAQSGPHPAVTPVTGPGVALLDLDYFKLYNDRNGHQAGDDLLRAVAALLQSRLPAGGLVARYGGEEFGVLLPPAELTELLEWFQRLQGQLPAGQTFSAGLSLLRPGEQSAAVVARADRALYEAKHTGRGCVVADDSLPPGHPPGPGGLWQRA